MNRKSKLKLIAAAALALAGCGQSDPDYQLTMTNGTVIRASDFLVRSCGKRAIYQAHNGSYYMQRGWGIVPIRAQDLDGVCR